MECLFRRPPNSCTISAVPRSTQTSRPGPTAWAVGVDLGGTWARVEALDHRARRRAFTAPTPGLAGLPMFIRRLWRRWGFAPADIAVLVVASRGVWTRAERRAQRRRLRALARRVQV